ncbi:MAG: hypothetical protein ABI183_13785 [Polyangiaceae bacterium]
MHPAANPAGRLVSAAGDRCERPVDRACVFARNDRPFRRAHEADNPKLLRAGMLISPEAPTRMLQIARMTKEAGNPARRTFGDAHALMTWLDPELSIDERAALEAFFA